MRVVSIDKEYGTTNFFHSNTFLIWDLFGISGAVESIGVESRRSILLQTQPEIGRKIDGVIQPLRQNRACA